MTPNVQVVPRERVFPFLASLIALAIAVSSAGAQGEGSGIVTGIVRDSAGTPLSMVELTVPGTTVRTLSDAAGTFRLVALPGGTHSVRARRLGYRATERSVAVVVGETATLSFILATLARELDPVVVQASPDSRSRYLAGFYQRKRLGFGRFITQDRLDLHTGTLPQLLTAELPGVRMVSGRTITQGIRLRGMNCAPLLWLDGAPTPAGEFDLSTLPPHTISGVEVYSGASTVPGEFQLPQGQHRCGVIVVWSRLYEGPRQRRPRKRVQLDSAIASLRVYAADEVEQPARVDSAKLTSPTYPDSLFAFKIEGEVLAEFVIDTTGEVREQSVGIISATHPQFAVVVEQALASSRFEPARHQGRKVPQVMILPFRFQLNRVAEDR